MISLRRILLLLALSSHAFPASSETRIHVSDKFQSIYRTESVLIPPGGAYGIDLYKNEYNDSYISYIHTKSPSIRLYLIDGRDRDSNNLNPRFIVEKPVYGGLKLDISGPKSDSGFVLMLGNYSKSPAKVFIRVDRIGKRPKPARDGIEDLLKIPFLSMEKFFYTPSIDVFVRPCGESNAYSTPNIVVCTELISELIDRGLFDAIYPILYHEMSHSYLRIWGFSGWENEDIADEFAAVFSDKDHTAKFIKYFDGYDPVAELLMKIISNDRHSISVDRMRHLQSAIDNRNYYLKKWSKVVHDYVRPTPIGGW